MLLLTSSRPLLRDVTAARSPMSLAAGNGNSLRDDATGSSSQQAAMTPEVTSRWGDEGAREVSEPLVMILDELAG